ncbi:MAG: T9SS type A sorting domain-containing protein [Ginsengibacter sp.]
MKKACLLLITVLFSVIAQSQISSNGTGGGLWSSTATWSGGVVPTASDDVTIKNGDAVTIDVAAVANSVNVGAGASGTLTFDANTAETLTVQTDVTIAPGGAFQSATTGTVTTHVLSLAGNLTNNGTLDLSTNGNTAGANITFTGASNNAFGGSGATTDIRAITIDKGTSSSNTLELNPASFTVQGTTADGIQMGFLTLTNGTLKVSGTFTLTGRIFTGAAYAIPATGGFWLNNPNFTVAGQDGSPANNGLLRITQGAYNIGTSSGNAIGAGVGAVFIIEGGLMNVSGRLLTANAITYTQTGGAVNICTVGNSAANSASFSIGTSGAVFNMSGGNISMVQINSNATAASRRDYFNLATPHITGGTLYVGTGNTAGNSGTFDYRIYGNVPNMIIDNTTNNKSVTAGLPAASPGSNVFRDYGGLTINPGTAFFVNGYFTGISGDVVNNGTINGNAASSRFSFFGTTPQTYSGSGVAGTNALPLLSFEVNNAAGVIIDPSVTNNIVTNRVTFFSGGFTNSNKITLGSGGASTGTVQMGNTTAPSNAGNFDVSPTFNLGTGGQVIFYLRVTSPRTTGPELNPTRILTSMIYDDTAATHSLTIAGGDLTLSGKDTALSLRNGRIVTGANILIITIDSADVIRTKGYVDGNFRKQFGIADSKTFEVGTANGYSPVTVNVTAGSPADFTVKATEGSYPGLDPLKSLKRSWTLTAPGITADLTFNYLDPTDIPGTASENNFVIFKNAAGIFTKPGGMVDASLNTATITGVTSFSDWTLAETSIVLPVNLLTFSGYKESNHNVLKWKTVNESNNKGFEIQRSTDGVNFSEVSFVNSQAPGGSSTGNLNYTFTDNNPAGTKQYYRLRQVDIDNHGKYSNILLIRGNKPLTLEIGGLFPNPANNIMNVIIGAPASNDVTLVITDIAGKTVKQQPANIEAGSNTIPMNIYNLAKGTYTVKVVSKADGQSAVSSFIKQ